MAMHSLLFPERKLNLPATLHRHLLLVHFILKRLAATAVPVSALQMSQHVTFCFGRREWANVAASDQEYTPSISLYAFFSFYLEMYLTYHIPLLNYMSSFPSWPITKSCCNPDLSAARISNLLQWGCLTLHTTTVPAHSAKFWLFQLTPLYCILLLYYTKPSCTICSSIPQCLPWQGPACRGCLACSYFLSL